jgi:hypothetical protein
MELWIQDNPEKALQNSQEEFRVHSERALKLKDQALQLKEMTRAGAMESIQMSKTIEQGVRDALLDSQGVLKLLIEPQVQTLADKLKSSKEDFEEKNKKLKAYFADINKNLTQSNALLIKLNSAVMILMVKKKNANFSILRKYLPIGLWLTRN